MSEFAEKSGNSEMRNHTQSQADLAAIENAAKLKREKNERREKGVVGFFFFPTCQIFCRRQSGEKQRAAGVHGDLDSSCKVAT